MITVTPAWYDHLVLPQGQDPTSPLRGRIHREAAVHLPVYIKDDTFPYSFLKLSFFVSVISQFRITISQITVMSIFSIPVLMLSYSSVNENIWASFLKVIFNLGASYI